MAENEKKHNKKPENNEGIQITPPDKNEKDKVEMCILCEKKPAYKTATVDSDLCEECRQGFLYTPIRYSGIIAIILVFITAVSGLLLFRAQKPAVKTVLDSCKALEAGDSQFAFSSLSDENARALIGWKSASVFSELFYKVNTPQNLQVLVDELFYDKEADPALKWQDIAGKGNINAPWNKELKAKYDYLKNLNSIIDKHRQPFADCQTELQNGKSASEIPYDKYIKDYETRLAAATSDEEKGIINYYMLNIAYLCNKDVRTQLEYCKQTVKLLPECRWIYLHDIITLSIRAGEYDTANTYNTILAKTDPLYAQRYNALMLRYQGKYSEALAILEPMIADYENNGMYEAFNDAMVCELLSGNLEGAYEYLASIVDGQIDPTLVNVNLYAMLSKKLGYESKYNELANQFEQYGMKISPTVDKYLNGEITIEEIFVEGEAVFE